MHFAWLCIESLSIHPSNPIAKWFFLSFFKVVQKNYIKHGELWSLFWAEGCPFNFWYRHQRTKLIFQFWICTGTYRWVDLQTWDRGRYERRNRTRNKVVGRWKVVFCVIFLCWSYWLTVFFGSRFLTGNSTHQWCSRSQLRREHESDSIFRWNS